MKRFIYTTIFILSIFSTIYGNVSVNKSMVCPKVELTNPPKTFNAGDLATYGVKLTGEFDKEKIKYKWEVSEATLVSGKETETLEIATTADSKLSASKIKLTIEGLDEKCQSVYVAENVGKALTFTKAMLVDEFNEIRNKDLKVKLDKLISKVGENPNATFYLLTYGDLSEMTRREKTFSRYLKVKMDDVSQIVYVRGGKKGKLLTRFWLLPKGADPSIIE